MHTVFLFSENKDLCDQLYEQMHLEDIRLSTEDRIHSLKKYLEQSNFDLAIIDLSEQFDEMIPLCKELKQEHFIHHVRLIVILPNRCEDKIVRAFQNGADDCVFQPVRVKELTARIKAVLRRGFVQMNGGRKGNVVRIADLEIHKEEYKAYHRGVSLELTKSEFKILYALASNPKRVYTRQQLLDQCGNLRDDSKGRSIDVHVRSLRKKIGNSADHIKTARGIGYYMDLPEES